LYCPFLSILYCEGVVFLCKIAAIQLGSAIRKKEIRSSIKPKELI
jgi:hypothetical protein